MEKMTCDTFLEFKFISDPAISPDAKHTAFLLQTPDIAANGYTGSICLYSHETGSIRPLTVPGPVKAFSWLDEKTIIFPAMRNAAVKAEVQAGEERTTYYTLSILGGEAQEAFTLPVFGGKLTVLGAGRYLLASGFDNNRPHLEGLGKTEREKALREYKNKGYNVLEEIPFWTNGVGVTNRKRQRLYLYDSTSDTLTCLTDDPLFKVGGFTVKNGKVLYIGSRFETVQTLRNGVFLYDLATGATKCLLEQDRYLVKLFEIYNNKAVLCLTDGLGYGNGQNGDFYTIDFETGELCLLAEHSHHCVGNTVGTDCKLGAGSTFKIMGDTLYYLSTVDQYSYIETLDLNTAHSETLTGPGSVEFLDAVGGRLVYLAFKGNRMGELYTLENGRETQLTQYNEPVYEKYHVSTPEYLTCDTGAPLPVQGWVMKPADYQPGKSYPAILTIHGGPRLTYGEAFTHEMQVWASQGYFVLYCNPRGSEGRGNEFADIRKRFGDIDYQDIMGFLDGALKAYPAIDPNRLGVSGGSYGGFMTNWIIGHTDRFKAACAQRSIANWTGFEGTADIGYYFAKGQTGASHMEDRALQWRQSPLCYADRVVTPTLFIHGDKDYRCWMLEALQMFTALKLHGVQSKLCLFEGENHELSRSGRPKQRVKRLEEMLAWYNKYLKGGQTT